MSAPHSHSFSAFALPAVPSADQAADGLRTLRDLIRWACTRLNAAGAQFGHGTDNAHDEAT